MACAHSCTSSQRSGLGRPRLYSIGKGRGGPCGCGRNSTTSTMPAKPRRRERTASPRETRTPSRHSSFCSWACSCICRPSAVSRFSTHCCSRWINAHCRSQNARCCRPESGSRSDSENIAASDHLVQSDSRRQSSLVYGHLIIAVRPRRLRQVSSHCLNPFEQRVSGKVAERTFVLKDNQFAGSHFATSRGAVVLEHDFESVPEQLEIILGEAGLRCKMRGDKSMTAVEGIGHNFLTAHGA